MELNDRPGVAVMPISHWQFRPRAGSAAALPQLAVASFGAAVLPVGFQPMPAFRVPESRQSMCPPCN